MKHHAWYLLLLGVLLLPGRSVAIPLILAWEYTNNPENPAVAFALYRLTGCAGEAVRFEVPVSTQTFTDPGPFVARLRYCYTVTAVNSVGEESMPSNTVAVQCKKVRRQQVLCQPL